MHLFWAAATNYGLEMIAWGLRLPGLFQGELSYGARSVTGPAAPHVVSMTIASASESVSSEEAVSESLDMSSTWRGS